MPKRIAVNRIVVAREGKNVVINPGEKFDFTKDEISYLEVNDAITTKEVVDVIDDEGDAVGKTKPSKGTKTTTGDNGTEVHTVEGSEL